MTSVPFNVPDPEVATTDLQCANDLPSDLTPDPSHSTISIEVRASEDTFCSGVALDQPTWVRTGERTAAALGDTSVESGVPSTPANTEWPQDSIEQAPSPGRVHLDVITRIESDDEKPFKVNAGMCCRMTMVQGGCCKVKPATVSEGKDVEVAQGGRRSND